jgi:hypothetical protein
MDELNALMEQTRTDVHFDVLMITDVAGNVIAAARADEIEPEALDALVQTAQRIAARPDDVATLSQQGESLFFDWEGRQIVVRWIAGKKPKLLLALVPPHVAFKRAIGGFIRKAKPLLKTV